MGEACCLLIGASPHDVRQVLDVLGEDPGRQLPAAASWKVPSRALQVSRGIRPWPGALPSSIQHRTADRDRAIADAIDVMLTALDAGSATGVGTGVDESGDDE